MDILSSLAASSSAMPVHHHETTAKQDGNLTITTTTTSPIMNEDTVNSGTLPQPLPAVAATDIINNDNSNYPSSISISASQTAANSPDQLQVQSQPLLITTSTSSTFTPLPLSLTSAGITSKALLSNLTKRSTGATLYTCPEPGCGKQYTTRQGLVAHSKLGIHNFAQGFQCKYCGKEYTSHKFLDNHERKVHADGIVNTKTQKCKSKKLQSQQQLQVSDETVKETQLHPSTNSPRAVVADGSSTTTATTSKTPFVCPVKGCGKPYGSTSGLRRHKVMVHGSVNPGSATNTSSSSFNNTASTSSTTATTNPNTGSHNRTTSAGTDTMTMMDEEMDIAAAAIQLQQSTRMSTKEEQCDEGGGATVMEIDQDEVTMVDLSSSLSVIPSTNASPSKSTPVIQQKPSTAAVTTTSPSLKKILHSCENQGCKKVYTSYSGIYRHRPLCPWKPKSMETVPSSSSSVIATTARRGRKNKSTLSDSDISAASDAQEEDDYDALNDEDHDKGEEGGNSDDEMVDEYKEDDGEDEEEQSARISATTTRRRSGRVRKPVIQPQLASTRTSSRRRRLSPPSEEVEEEHDGEESQSGDEENGSEDELRPKPPVAARTNRYTFTNPVPPPVSSSASTTASSAPSNRYAFSYPVPAPAASSTTTTTASYANINTTSKPRSIYMSAAADSAHHNKQTDVDEIAAEIAVPGKRVTVKVYGTMMPRAAKLSYTDASDEEEDTGEKGEVDRGSQEEDLDEEDGMEESEEEEDVDDSEAEFKPDAKVSVIIEGNKKKVIVEEHDDESSFDGSVLDSEEEDGDDAGSDSETGVGGGAKIGFMKKLSSRQHLPAPVISECDPSSLMASKRNRGKPKALHPGTVAIKEKIEGLFYKTGGEGQEQEMKMDKDEQKPPIPLEWVDNRMPCPNPACKQRFSGRAYLEQHLRHYTHEIFDILEWGFPAPVAVAAAAAAAGSSSETTTSSAGSHSDSALISPALPPPEIPDLEKEGSIEYRLSKIEESVRRVCDYVDTDDLPIKIKMDLAMWKKAKYLQTPRPPPETILQCELLFGYSIEREEAELKWQDFKNKPLSKQRVASASTSAAAARGGGGDKKVYKRRTSKYDPEISAKPTPTSFSNISTTTVKHGNDYPEMFVYPGLQPCLEHFQIVDNETATDYIPVCEDDQGIKVSNHSSKSKNKDDFTYIPMFSASTLSNAGKQGVNSHILNAGSSIWGLDFAPSLHTDTQYLAVAGYKSTTERHVLGVRQVEEEDDDPNMKGCIQIWSLPNCVDKVDNSRGQKSARRSSSSSSVNDQQEDKNEEEMDEGMDVDQQVAQLEVCILHEFGCVYDIKWCPYGGYESEEEFKTRHPNDKTVLPRLGILAVTFGDGNMRIIPVPHPSALRHSLMSEFCNLRNTLYVKLRTSSTSEADETNVQRGVALDTHLSSALLWKVCWGGHQIVASGCSNGAISVWDLEVMFEGKTINSETIHSTEPYLYFRAHDSSVRSLEFGNNEVRLASSSEITSRSKNSDVPPRPHLLMSSGSDGRLLMHDLRDSFGYMALQRVRGFILASAWCSSSNFIIFNDTDHFIRIMNLSDYLDPSLMQRSVENTMDRNVRTGGLMFHEACIWSCAISKYMPFALTGSSDGSVKISNMARVYTRSHKPLSIKIYRIDYDKETNIFKYVEGGQEQALLNVKKSNFNSSTKFFAMNTLVQKVVWNPNPRSASWIASSSTCGLVRIDSVYSL